MNEKQQFLNFARMADQLEEYAGKCGFV